MKFIFYTGADAIMFLNAIYSIYTDYKSVTLADVHDYIDRVGTATEMNYGWEELTEKNFKSHFCDGKYVVCFPPCKKLKSSNKSNESGPELYRAGFEAPLPYKLESIPTYYRHN